MVNFIMYIYHIKKFLKTAYKWSNDIKWSDDTKILPKRDKPVSGENAEVIPYPMTLQSHS